MPGAEALGLMDPAQVSVGQGGAHLLTLMAMDNVNGVGLEGAGGFDHPTEHGLAGDRLEDLGDPRAHASSRPGGKDDNAERRPGHRPQLRLALLRSFLATRCCAAASASRACARA